MRYTHKLDKPEGRCNYFLIPDQEQCGNAENKLGQLEDIEEEFEMDLLTVFKAVMNGFYDVEGNFYEPYDFSIDLESKCLRETFEDYMKSKSFGFCEFGKTWFLTKDELNRESLTPPTEKQLNFIKSICDELGLDNPEPKTKEEARRFISEHCDEFYEHAQWMYQSDWAIANGYF